MEKNEFTRLVANAYQHFYDLVHLRTHPLTNFLFSDASLSRKEKARQLQRILEDVIKELDPGPHAPAYSREWRRHQLMVLRYLDGLDPNAVADELGVSRRHYYREHEGAIEAIASILLSRYQREPSGGQQIHRNTEDQEAPDRLELVRLEAARTAHAGYYTGVNDMVQGVLSLLQDMLQQRKLTVYVALPEMLPVIFVDRNLLRNVLLGILGYLIGDAYETTIRITAQVTESALRLSFEVESPAATSPAMQTKIQERLAALEEMATLSGIQIQPLNVGHSIAGFDILLPAGLKRTVLVVDDNEDILELFQRYLSPHPYRVVTAQTAHEALTLARQLHPDVITLDLMMPDQDGWDLLQVLLNQVDTHQIPIIVCSVLRQKDLALSLGAAAFLEKPVTEQGLLSALEDLEKT